ncbi:MAG: alpha-2-macroglobulin family protein [Hyphomicrobiaceae bacterium]|nr:MAG: alpha-2-macroglobulin family protein [Hyphomicrobiaceae bacterium]
MSLALRVLIGLLLMLSAGLAQAQEARFTHAGVEADAKRYETYLKANWQPGKRTARDLRLEGDRTLAAGTDPRAASRFYAQAAVADASDAEAWLGLARALLAIKPDQGSERYDLPVNASGAAWNAYQRGQAPAAKAAALWVLHDALKRRSYWRPAIDALKTSLTLVDDPNVRQAYDTLVAQHGFRILEYKVDADSAQPRLCIQFSERLAPGQIEWAKYFTVDGKDPQTVTAESRQICLDGMAHGKRYEVQVRAGLPSAVGEKLLKTAELAVYVRDRNPSVRVTGRGYVLPNRGQQGIPLVTVNTDKIDVEVYRIGDRSIAQAVQGGDFNKQISTYDLDNLKQRTGARVYTGELAVTSRLNEDVTTAFPIAEALPRLQPGVYVLAATAGVKKGNDDSRNPATQWFIVSDLGLAAINGDDGMHTFVRSLVTATPVVNANVRLIARNNEVLATAKTDSRGYARFDAGLKRGEGGLAPAVLVAEAPDGDYAFMDLSTAAFDLTDRGVKGRQEPGPIDAFAYTERGVYRPGEQVHLTALARDRTGRSAAVPLTLIFSRPDGVEHSRVALTDQGLGGRTTKLSLAPSAMTGTWRVGVHTDPKAPAIANAAFLVEDFVPERLELKLEAATPALSPQEPGTIRLAGRYLYGPPATGLAIEGEIAVKASKSDVPGFAGYRFGLADEQFSPIRKPLERLPTTDGEGKANITIELPAVPRTNRPLEADVIFKLRESGGRTIERTITLPIDMKSPRIGIKPLFSGGQIGEGDTAAFEAIVLGADSKPVAAKGLKWELLRLDQRWQWYSRDGSWNYEPTTHTRRIGAGTVDFTPGAPARIESRLQWGRYRLEVSASDGSGLISSMIFNTGYWADEAADSPEVLDVALDKPSYKVGDTARLKVNSRIGGRALIAVLSSGLATTQEVELPAGGGEVPLRVTADWNPGAYVTVMLYRPMDEKAKRMPSRALGLRWLAVDQAPRTIKVGLDLPEKVKSGATLTVPVRLTGLASGEEARITVAAVDVGILNLTRFEAPKPEGWFFGQRRLGSEIRDLYGRLIDGMRAERGKLRSGGDGAADGMSMQGTPPVEETLALFSGIVKVAADGTAKVDFQLPDFNGTVRVSVVAWSADKLGSASRDLIVRDPVALTVSGPRFLTLGDQARLELAVHNVEGPAGAYTVTGQYELEPGAMSQPVRGFERSVTLAAGERKREAFQLKPSEVGLTTLAVRVTGPNGIDVRRRLNFDVKVPAGDIRRLSVSSLSAKGGKITLTDDLVQDMIARRTKVSVTVGPMAAMDVPGVLAALDRYPYGCAEQTTSRALPLLYVNDVARRLGMATDALVRERVEKAIERVFEMQDASGAFGIWGPSDGDMWLTSYVTDFLTRAKEQGYTVRQRPFNQALDRLQNYISYAQDFERGGEARAYALYVLARNARAPIGELRYYVDTKLDSFATPLAQAQLGAALAMLGDKVRAERALQAALKTVTEKDEGDIRRDYGTGVRDGAALITLASETGIAKPDLPRLVDIVAKAFAAKTYTSTQEQAWMLLAARTLGEEAKSTTLSVNGQPHQGQLMRSLSPAELKSGALTIVNTGNAATDAVVSVIGAALTPEPAISKGFSIERAYYTLDGKQIDLQSATGGNSELKQNERLVVVLKVSSAESGGRILLVDRLPAGLEIENPRLVDSSDIKSLGWLKTTVRPDHADFRDDRFVASFDFFGSSTRRGRNGDDNREASSSATVAYVVRAVTPGSFVHPAATVEDMYRPDRFARTASGRLEVTARE